MRRARVRPRVSCPPSPPPPRAAQLLPIVAHANYLYRLTALDAVLAMADSVPRHIASESLLPVVLTATKVGRVSSGCGAAGRGSHPFTRVHLVHSQDTVPNVRFKAAAVLGRLAALVEPGLVARAVKPCLTELASDADADVRYFAQAAAAQCDSV